MGNDLLGVPQKENENGAISGLPVMLSVKALARFYDVQERTIRDARWRRRIGLVVVRAGCHVIGAFPDDVRCTLKREHAPGE